MNHEPPNEADSIGSLFVQLIEDAERFVRAEMRLYREQLFARLSEVRTGLVVGAVALLLAQSALIAMLVGMMMILRGPLGPVWATVAVVIGALLIAAVLIKYAIEKLTGGRAIEADKE